jgi:ABC-type Fe3+ transport system substrate-binding protein
VLSKNTIASIDEILRGNDRRFDIFWSSSPEAFEILNRQGAFVDGGLCGADRPSPVAAFALSSVGWARRIDSELFMPAEWNDLLRPIYRDRIAMARPARSGSTHVLVEQLLQVRGWDAGWAYLLELSGNLSTLTARSFGVPDGLLNARFDIGLTLDFLAQSQAETLNFRYGRPLVVIPAQIGILRNGLSPQAACDFVKLVLSREGQMLLLSPPISRVPYDPSVRAEFGDRLPADILNTLRLPWLSYNAATAADRYWVVKTIFDLMITENLDRRRNLWRRYHVLNDVMGSSELSEIRRLLTRVIIEEIEAASLPQVETGLRTTSLVQLGPNERQLTEDWRQVVVCDLDAVEWALRELEAANLQ